MAKLRDRDGVRLGLAALVLRVVVTLLAWGRVPPTADGKFYHVVAERIANGDGYTWLWPDGAVTFAAHYPIGYPALMALPYGLFGPHPGGMMLVNAVLGAAGVWACHGVCWELVVRTGFADRARLASAIAAGLLVVSPTLLGYTPALMTEGAVASVLALAARLAIGGEDRGGGRLFARLLGLSLLLGFAVLLRPQSVLFAPVLGVLSVQGSLIRRAMIAAVVSVGCLAVVLPWTARNCDKMERCVFVSANGGWNLLIGTFPEGRGAWVALEGDRVPEECREVYQEAAKDKCFGQAGVRRIETDPWPWLKLVPAKLRATLNHTAAASDHLAEAGVVSGAQKYALAVLEYAGQRIAFGLALLGAWSVSGAVAGAGLLLWLGRLLLVLGALGFGGFSATLGWVSVLGLLAVNPRSWTLTGVGWGGFAVLSTMVVHGVFFGAGRYALPLLLCTAPLSAVGAAFLLQRGYASRTRSTAEV